MKGAAVLAQHGDRPGAHDLAHGGLIQRLAIERAAQADEHAVVIVLRLPHQVLARVQEGSNGVGQHALIADADRQDIGMALDAMVLVGTIHFLLHHFGIGRLLREQHDQVIGVAQLPVDLVQPGRARAHRLVDEADVAALVERFGQELGQGAVLRGVALIADEDARLIGPHQMGSLFLAIGD